MAYQVIILRIWIIFRWVHQGGAWKLDFFVLLISQVIRLWRKSGLFHISIIDKSWIVLPFKKILDVDSEMLFVGNDCVHACFALAHDFLFDIVYWLVSKLGFAHIVHLHAHKTQFLLTNCMKVWVEFDSSTVDLSLWGFVLCLNTSVTTFGFTFAMTGVSADWISNSADKCMFSAIWFCLSITLVSSMWDRILFNLLYKKLKWLEINHKKLHWIWWGTYLSLMREAYFWGEIIEFLMLCSSHSKFTSLRVSESFLNWLLCFWIWVMFNLFVSQSEGIGEWNSACENFRFLVGFDFWFIILL